MSNYSQEEQVGIVRDAMTLQTVIQIETQELEKLKRERFQARPVPPTRQVLALPQVSAQLPAPPKTNLKLMQFLKELPVSQKILYIALAMTGVLFFPVLVYVYYQFSKECRRRNMELAQSAEYQKEVAKAEQAAAQEQERARQETAKRQTALDTQYKTELERYNTVELPAYEKELAKWEQAHAEKIAIMEADLDVNEGILEELYDTTKLISLTYRELWILRWLYDDMRTSDHDIRYATELLDRDRQRTATERSGLMVREAVQDMQVSMESGFRAVYEAVEEGNEELVKTRRSQNAANVAAIAQRHNLSKAAKKQNEMLEEHFEKFKK